MIVTIEKVNRTVRQSKKTGKDFESLGLLVTEQKLTDINGDELERGERWLSGFGRTGVTDAWKEGDQVKILIIRKMGKGADGVEKEYLNFDLPKGVSPIVSSSPAVQPDVQAEPSADDF